MNNRVKVGAIIAVTVATLLGATPALAHGGGGYTCTGGDIPSGSYSSISVTGQCSVPSGAVISVGGSVTIAKGAALDAQSAPATITVGRDVNGFPGAMVGLGCQPMALVGNSGHSCTVNPEGHSTIKIGGSITLVKPAIVLLNGITVKKNVTVLGGGSPVPWSIKNNTIAGNVTVTGQTTEWIGVMFNKIGANVTLLKINITDTDPGAAGVFVVQNQIARSLICYGLTPGVSGGFAPGAVNVVGGRALGQCSTLV